LQDISESFELVSDLEEEWLEKISEMPIEGKLKRNYRRYWKKQNSNVGLIISRIGL
jgi:hypothetical protein